ncbi:MAG TPA: GNAT family N-acetyltransferase [Solirubrobacterales bacterium]
MSPAAIREARTGEERALLGAYEWLFAAPGARPPGWDPARAAAALAEAIAGERATVLVAEVSGTLAGICSAYLDLNSARYGLRCWVEDLAVEPGARSRGIGGALLDAVSEWARGRGATHLELDTGLARTDAQRFYERRNPDTVGYSYSWAL